jgi:hypothetical protein
LPIEKFETVFGIFHGSDGLYELKLISVSLATFTTLDEATKAVLTTVYCSILLLFSSHNF